MYYNLINQEMLFFERKKIDGKRRDNVLNGWSYYKIVLAGK